MKKLLSLLLCAVMVLSLAACGGDKTPQNDNDQPSEPAQSVDLKKTAEDAIASIDSEDVILLPEENQETIESLYPGLTSVATKQLVVYLPPVMGNACELVMVEAASPADAETVRGILQARVDSAANDTVYPDNAEGWKNGAVVTVNGNYVVMGVLPSGVEMPAAFKAQF